MGQCGRNVERLYRLVKGCMARKDADAGRQVHALVVESGYESNTFLANHMIRMYAAVGDLEGASRVFSKVVNPDTFVWEAIISAHGEAGRAEEAMRLYQQMRRWGARKVNDYVFVAVLKACGNARELRLGRMVHADVVGCGLDANVYVGNTLLDMYAKCESVGEARGVFEGMGRKRDVVSWSAMIGGYADKGMGQEAVGLFRRMQEEEGVVANHVTYVSMLKACGKMGALQEGRQIHGEIVRRGLQGHVSVGNSLVDMYVKCGKVGDAREVLDGLWVRDVVGWNALIGGYAEQGLGQEALEAFRKMPVEPDRVTFVNVLKACGRVGAVQDGKCLHAQLLQRGLEADGFVGSALVDMYAKCGSLKEARAVFDRLCTKDVVTWNVLVAGYAQAGLGEQALDVFATMQRHGITPDKVTIIAVLKVCADTGAIHHGRRLHAHILERGLEADMPIANTLLHMYSQCGTMVDVRALFDWLPNKDVVTWTSIINAYGHHHQCGMAIRCFHHMQQYGVQPDAATFTCLLAACAHVGWLNTATHLFQAMVEVHAITPTRQHYNCMADLLARAGHLDEAHTLLQTMPFHHDAVGFMSLLTATKAYRNVHLAERCFHQLLQLEPNRGAAYVLMSHIYAAAGSWANVKKVDRMRRRAGASIKPAQAWIEVNNRLHNFTVGQKRNDTSFKLNNLNLQVHGGDQGHDQLPDKVKEDEDALCGHAEKLALAFGLLNTPQGQPLVVHKNLRMCDHCHSGTKIISRIERREIIVRDAHRVHHFKDGICSCGHHP